MRTIMLRSCQAQIRTSPWMLCLILIGACNHVHAFTTPFVRTESGWKRRDNSALFGAKESPMTVPTIASYDASMVNQTFSELYKDHVPEWLLEKCEAYGYINPTLIQQRALDTFFLDEPNSVVIQAQTGSGKTLTYLLPLLASLEDRSAIQAMIIVPTRELGLQVATIAKRLAGRKFMVMSILQGSQHRRQRAWAWAETPHVVIGTPSEMLDMVKYAGLPRINSVEYVVVDEVDACLVHNSNVGADSSNKLSSSSSLNQLLSKFLSPTFMEEEDIDDPSSPIAVDVPKRRKRRFKYRQTVFCSATIPQHRHFLKQCKSNQWTLEEPIFVCANPGESLPPTLKHAYMVCNSKNKKLATLRRLVQKISKGTSQSQITKILVFCETNRPMEEMAMAIAHDNGGKFFQEGKRDTLIVDEHSKSVVSVLRLEDSLSQRAAATRAFSETTSANESGDASSNTSNGDDGMAGPMFRLMFTTDLAARGLDIAGITHVIHFDLPRDADAYLHRSGRAGRLGRQGQVISILTPDQEFVLERLTNSLSLSVACIARQKK